MSSLGRSRKEREERECAGAESEEKARDDGEEERRRG